MAIWNLRRFQLNKVVVVVVNRVVCTFPPTWRCVMMRGAKRDDDGLREASDGYEMIQ